MFTYGHTRAGVEGEGKVCAPPRVSECKKEKGGYVRVQESWCDLSYHFDIFVHGSRY